MRVHVGSHGMATAICLNLMTFLHRTLCQHQLAVPVFSRWFRVADREIPFVRAAPFDAPKAKSVDGAIGFVLVGEFRSRAGFRTCRCGFGRRYIANLVGAFELGRMFRRAAIIAPRSTDSAFPRFVAAAGPRRPPL